MAVGIKKFWTEDSKINSLFKVYKDQQVVPENYEYTKSSSLHYDILKNKNIDYYCKRNDKKYADIQQLLKYVLTALINIVNSCLEADKFNKIIESKALVTKAANAITIMGELNSMINNERKISF